MVTPSLPKRLVPVEIAPPLYAAPPQYSKYPEVEPFPPNAWLAVALHLINRPAAVTPTPPPKDLKSPVQSSKVPDIEPVPLGSMLNELVPKALQFLKLN